MSTWSIQLQPKVLKDLRGFGSVERKRVLRYLHDRVQKLQHPQQLGAPLSGNLSGLWRYRVGDIRIIAQIDEGQLVVLVVAVGKRGEIYR